jgi:hypothetical protein
MSTSLLGAGGWAVLLGLSATLLWAEGGPRVPTFSAGVEVVSLSVAVTDARGGQVPELGAEDLAVFEDGVAQRSASSRRRSGRSGYPSSSTTLGR